MFYAQFVLSKKGPLAKIWLAAHWEKKLSKAQIYETDVQDAVDEILKPKVKMALRTTGHLLLGIVRIYSRKTKYLLADCNEACLRIKIVFRTNEAELLEEGKQAPAPMMIPGLPEVFDDFDAALDFNDDEFANHMQENQSRFDDITLKEDYGEMRNRVNNFGMDDFGELAIGGMDQDFGSYANGAMDDDIQDFAGFDASNIEEGRHNFSAQNSALNERNVSPALILNNKPGEPIFNSMNADFGEIGGAIEFNSMEVDVPFNINMTGDVPLAAPGAEFQSDNVAVANAENAPNELEESFALEPLEADALHRLPRRNARKRRLIIDDKITIGGDEMKANVADYSDILQDFEVAPRTKKMMKIREEGTVEKLFQMPGCSFFKAKPIVKLYQSHLIMKARTDDQTPIADEIRRDLELSENIEEEAYIPQAEINFGDDFDDIAPLPMDDFRVETPPPMPELAENMEESPMKQQPEDVDSQNKENINPEKTVREDETSLDGKEDNRWTKRTQGVLNTISNKLKTSEKIVLNDLLEPSFTRKKAAQRFYTLLVLKKMQAIDVSQDEPYGDIVISAGPNISQAVV